MEVWGGSSGSACKASIPHGVLPEVPATLLLIQLAASVSGNVTEEGPGVWAFATDTGYLTSGLSPAPDR